MILVRAAADAEAGAMPGKSLKAVSAKYHEERMWAGIPRDVSGFKRARRGRRIRGEADGCSIIAGPGPEAKMLIACAAIIEVKSNEEALPRPGRRGADAEIGIPQAFEREDLARRARRKEVAASLGGARRKAVAA
jgi:hypothetical protein